PPWNHIDNLGPLHADAIARYYDGLVYVVNRYGADNIQVLDPGDSFSTVLQFSTGAGSNPQDICFVEADRAFVTRYDRPELWEVDPLTGDHTDTIDLAPLADGDGVPEMHGMAIHGGYLYVTLQRLDRDYWWIPVYPSYLAVIDLQTNELLDMDPQTPGMQGLPLLATNPNSYIAVDPLTADFLIGEVGDYGATDGGIERYDPNTQQSLGFVVTEETLGGDLCTWETANGIRGFASVLTQTWATSIVCFDVAGGENLGTLITSGEYAYAHLLVDRRHGQLFVADFTYANPGIRVFDTLSLDELSPGPISVGLYPHWLLALQEPGSGVEDRFARWTHGFEVWPQPASEGMSLRLRSVLSNPIDLEILDLQGRRVASLLNGQPTPGGVDLYWNGRDDRGRSLPSGTYLVRLRSREGVATRRILLVR
ncbi:MAG: T9SS type A sorting domain-containing protein, partial [Candidatus Eisenbacteria sp.]|nr:T9SS type A sorting domain-containing protein [Candidatus Eisenbacteria bacterium]